MARSGLPLHHDRYPPGYRGSVGRRARPMADLTPVRGPSPMVTIVPIDTPTLGDRSYLVHDGEVAFVVDPQRDIDRVLALLERARRAAHPRLRDPHPQRLRHRRAGAGPAHRRGVPRQRRRRGRLRARPRSATATSSRSATGCGSPRWRRPGHTFTHLSYALADGADGRAGRGVFSGGSLLYGATGRPDLLGAEHTHDLVRHQHASAHRLADAAARRRRGLPDPRLRRRSARPPSPRRRPRPSGRRSAANPVLTQDEETYVERAAGRPGRLAGLLRPHGPGQRRRARRAGPERRPRRPTPPSCARRIEAGEWVVDLRNRTAFAAGHVPGTLNFGLDGGFATYLGWLIAWGTPLTLLGETAEDGRRGAARAGPHRHRPARRPRHRHARRTGPTGALGRVPDRHVRRPGPGPPPPRRSSSSTSAAPTSTTAARIDGAVNIPLHELPGRLDEVPAGEVWVHCAGGYRASVAASLLDAAGRRLVAVDDSFDNAAEGRAAPGRAPEA